MKLPLDQYKNFNFIYCLFTRSKFLAKMVSCLCNGLWNRDFMATHSLSGKKSPTDKSKEPPKPALPADPVQAITSNLYLICLLFISISLKMKNLNFQTPLSIFGLIFTRLSFPQQVSELQFLQSYCMNIRQS